MIIYYSNTQHAKKIKTNVSIQHESNKYSIYIQNVMNLNENPIEVFHARVCQFITSIKQTSLHFILSTNKYLSHWVAASVIWKLFFHIMQGRWVLFSCHTNKLNRTRPWKYYPSIKWERYVYKVNTVFAECVSTIRTMVYTSMMLTFPMDIPLNTKFDKSSWL